MSKRSTTPITQPLPGERVIALSPQNAEEAALTWQRRPNLFAGRALTAGTLDQRQQWQAGHIATRGQSLVAGIDDGLQLDIGPDGGASLADATLHIEAGRALTVSGEDVVLTRTLECRLADVPVVAPPGFFIDGSGVGDSSGDGTVLPRRVGLTLGTLPEAALATLPAIGILLLQPALVDRADFDPLDPCDRSACADGAVDDVTAFEDWRIGDAVRLLWYVWPSEWRALPAVPDLQLRNALAWTVFDAEAHLPVGDCLPWEEWGAPLAMVRLDANRFPAWADRASVARHGGMARDARLQLGAAPPADADATPNGVALIANSRLPALWQAQIEQFAEQVAAAGSIPAGDLADAFARRLPPVGLLPRNAYDPAAFRSDFFPPGFDIDAAPVPIEQLDIAVRANAALAPLDPSVPESVRLLVPVPLQSWEPRLLLTEAVDPLFFTTLNRFLLDRARALGGRQGLRLRDAVLQHALAGIDVTVPAFDNDAAALETETLSPWGPPPAGGGHRSALLAGLHQHFFFGASETLPVGEDALFCWVYLDPINPPRELMLQWHVDGQWEQRAYWGENLIGWGVDGTPSRQRIGDLPEAGRWLRLDVPAALVGLPGRNVDGIAFTLFDGQAAYGSSGAFNANGERRWFDNPLPALARTGGEEPWVLLTHNDLWTPFEPTAGVLPAVPTALPATLGGHFDALASGMHQHFFDTVTTPFTITAGEKLFCWVWLDPTHPPRELMLQWFTAKDGWEQRAFWGWDLIGWGVAGTRSRLRQGALPAPGGWLRLEVSAASLGLEGAPLLGMAFTQYDGLAAFGAAGALTATGSGERVWFAGSLPPGAVQRGDTWHFIGADAMAMRSPLPSAQVGQAQALADLAQHPALQVLSAQERAQIHLLGAEGFTAYLKARTDRADDVVDYGFVKVQTDIYRVRQLVLGNTAATRLAVSPTLAGIALSETATASQTQINSFIADLKLGQSTAGAFASMATAPKVQATETVSLGTSAATSTAPVASRAFLLSSGLTSSLSTGLIGNLDLSTIQLGTVSTVSSPTLLTSKELATTTSIQRLPTTSIAVSPSPLDVASAAPLVGQTFIRTTTIAKRLEDPKSKEVRDYSTSSRFDAINALVRLVDALSAEDGGATPGLFEGIDVHGLQGDEFLADLPGEVGQKPIRRPFTDFIANRALLGRLMTVPLRVVQGDPDEGAFFSDATDLSDHVIALMRQVEGRVKRYREALTVCQQAVDSLRGSRSTVLSGLARLAEDLAEARHDVSVTRALLAEETERINAINARRAQVLAEQVHFIAYVRPREADNLRATLTHSVDPGLLEAPVPACLREHPDLPEELADMLRVVREAPANWFVSLPPLIRRLDKVEPLIRTLQTAQVRALSGIAAPLLSAAGGVAVGSGGNTRLAAAISQVSTRQAQALAPRLATLQTLNITSLLTTTWQGLRVQAEQVLSFADVAEGGHGRSDVARAAASELENIRRIVACLHAEFSMIPPALRLIWSETLSEFDAAPNLRNLASLPRWSELGYIDRRQMQAYVDWLFGQIEPGQPQAVALVNDVVRMCLLLASHAPVDRIVTGRLARPIPGVRPGIRIPLTVLEPAKLRVGMQAVLYRADQVVARAVVEDLGQLEVSAQVIHTTAAQVDLGDDVRVHFDDNASLSLAAASARRSLFGR